jgi:phosphoesterase RecJ-like protein
MDFERAGSVLSSAPAVAIACHVNPDADALGSMLGLASVLRARGVDVTTSVPNDPFSVPPWLRLLPGGDRLTPAHDFPQVPDVMVTCDCASSDRLQQLLPIAKAAKELIWIDHHRSNDGLGTIPLVDPDASSTCAMGAEPTDDAAVCLYAGLVTDTGRFQYQATTPETLRVAAALREHPFDHARLVQALYEDNGRDYLGVVGAALGRLRFVPEVDLVWTYLTQADLSEAGVHPNETDDLIDVIRTDREADVAVLVKQQPDGAFKVSARSRGAHDLSVIAQKFGGGGHRLAAGYTSEVGPVETIDLLVAALGTS